MPQGIAPTKSNLISARASLAFSKNGYDLLDRKRNVLIREMMSLIGRANDIQGRIDDTFRDAYDTLKVANLTEGISTVEDIASSIKISHDFEILLKSVMGVEVPNVRFERRELDPEYSFYRTNNAFDIAVEKFREVKYLVYEIAEVENSVYRLAREVIRTQRRTNALENIQIPKYTNIVKSIEDSLDEREREDFYRLKMVKRRTAGRKRKGI